MTAAIKPTDFQRLFGASALSNLGDGIRMAAFPLLAASMTKDPLMIALVAAAGMAPWLVFGLYAGSLADRLDRLRLLRSANAARAIMLTALATLILVDFTSLILVALVAFALGVAEVLTDSTVSTITPSVVAPADLDRANSRLAAAEILGNEFAGPAIGGVLFATGAALPFLTNAGLMATSLMLLAGLGMMVPSVASTEPDPSAWSGWAQIRSDRRLTSLTIASSILGAVDAIWFTLLVKLVQDTLALPAFYFAVLLSVGAVGGFLGALLSDRVKSTLPRIGVAVFGSMSVSLALFVISPTLLTTTVALITTSAGFAVWNVKAVTARQRITPDPVLGRVTATYRVIVIASALVSTVAGGLFARQFGIVATVALSSVLALAAIPVTLRLDD